MAAELDPNFNNLFDWLQLDRSKAIGDSLDPGAENMISRPLPRLEDQVGDAEENDFSPENLSAWLNREQVIADWMDAGDSAEDQLDLLALQFAHIQNDYMAACHRDLSLRFGNRIRRITHEAGRRRGHGAEQGFIFLMKSRFARLRARERILNEGGIE